MLNSVGVTGFNFNDLDCSFLDMGVSYSTFLDPKDFNKPPGVYWIQGTGGHYSEWDGQKFDDYTPAAKKATNDYYRDWHDSCHYYATGGVGIWQSPYSGGKVEVVTLPFYTFDQSGSFTEPVTFETGKLWTEAPQDE